MLVIYFGRHKGCSYCIRFIVEAFIIYDINNTPTALDVYQGNTELRITYEGKVPVDSVVIYKKKVHETE